MLRIRREASRALLMALLFYVFFMATKHVGGLAAVNSFGEDPYDAVGSFGIQIAIFLALLSCLRSLLPSHDDAERTERFNLVTRGNLLALSAVALTLIADLVALARHVSLWSESRNGLLLSVTTVIFLLLILYELTRNWVVFRNLKLSPNPHRIVAVFLTVTASTVCLAVYPEHWRSGLVGVLGTAIFGMLLIFVQLGVIASTLRRRSDEPARDLVDDVVEFCEAIKRWLPQFAPIYRMLNSVQRSRVPAGIAEWINPRRFRWRLCILSGTAVGLLMILMELFTESIPSTRTALLLIAIFVSFEGLGVTLGYALFGQPLSLFRDERKIA